MLFVSCFNTFCAIFCWCVANCALPAKAFQITTHHHIYERRSLFKANEIRCRLDNRSNNNIDTQENAQIDAKGSKSKIAQDQQDREMDTGPMPEIKKTTCITGISPPTPTPLNEVICRLASLKGEEVSLEQANELIQIGAVWARMDLMTKEDILAQYYTNSDSNKRNKNQEEEWYLDLPKGWGGGTDIIDESSEENINLNAYIEQMQNQRYKRILNPILVPPGTDLRFYPNPRRFPSCYEMNKEANLLYEDTTFIVVDKPPMLPTQPDASNYFENCPGCTQDLLGPFEDITGKTIRRPLLCHRVDSCVGGVVVMSKDENGQNVFSKFQRERAIKKLYLAVTRNPPPIGIHVHWMWSLQNVRGRSGDGPPCQLVSHIPPESRRKARQFWTRCVLEVNKCVPIMVDGEKCYQNTIRLVTGRKHQVRAQLASLNCPIIKDTLYEPIAGWTLEQLEIDNGAQIRFEQAVAKCRVPTETIGLQAHAILFGGIRAKARTPWWGEDYI